MSLLKEKYQKEVIAKMRQEFGYKNIMAVPKISKVVLNVGVGQALTDASFLEVVEKTLLRIAGQKPVKTQAKKSIASFKIRQGMTVGFKVTLRGARMWDFLDKLVHVTLPRVHDFRGINPKSFDHRGNYSLGLKEFIAFPEMHSDEIEKVHGVEITVATTAKTDKEALALLKNLGFPFKDQ